MEFEDSTVMVVGDLLWAAFKPYPKYKSFTGKITCIRTLISTVSKDSWGEKEGTVVALEWNICYLKLMGLVHFIHLWHA